ncbi:MAG: LytTR family transcriptional regulator DNA-binding domain-containing protein [Paracoccaceae bacterium]
MYWFTIVIVTVIVVQIVKVFVNIWFPNFWLGRKAFIVSAVLVATLAPILLLITNAVEAAGNPIFAPFWLIALLTFFLTMIVMFLQNLVGVNAFKERPLLYKRLKNPETKDIYRLTVRDHYVDVYSDKGKETLLMRFADALAELEGQNGRQVHRSHWVSCDAVDNIRKENGRMYLAMVDGSKVPVSRTNETGCLAEFEKLRGRAAVMAG